MARHERWELTQMQSLPLEVKIKKTQQRIKEWVDFYGEDGVYVSFSGGKDSTVLLDIVRKMYPNIQAVFVDTGLEYPSVRKFAESKENVITLRPSMNFREVLVNYGYPIIGKEVAQSLYEARHLKEGKTKTMRIQQFLGEIDMNFMKDFSIYNYLLNAPFEISHKCCDVMKKNPCKSYAKEHKLKRIMGTMAEESKLRLTKWLKEGCNAFEAKEPNSSPMSFWTENDVLTYIHTYNLSIADAYGQVVVKNNGVDGQINLFDMLGDYRGCQYETTGCKRTGCIFCMFGIKQNKKRFIDLNKQEPKLCDYCLRGGAFDKSDGMWKPGNGGLGMWFVIEWLNVHGNLDISIPNRDHYLSEYQTKETEKYLILGITSESGNKRIEYGGKA